MAIFSPSGGARPQTEWRAGGGAQHRRRITTRWTGVPTSRDVSYQTCAAKVALKSRQTVHSDVGLLL